MAQAPTWPRSFCDACNGKRLKPEIFAVTLGGEGFTSSFKTKSPKLKSRAVHPWTSARCRVETADEFFAALTLTEFEQKIAAEVIREIRARLGFLKNVGLGYLTLDREAERHVERRRGPAASGWPRADWRGAGRRAVLFWITS